MKYTRGSSILPQTPRDVKTLSRLSVLPVKTRHRYNGVTMDEKAEPLEDQKRFTLRMTWELWDKLAVLAALRRTKVTTLIIQWVAEKGAEAPELKRLR